MRELDNEFFEEYKRLDKLCREIFASEKGVGEYINQMEIKATQGIRNVPWWDVYYKRLKRWRWLRNQLAHSESAVCEEEDLIQLREFYDSIFAIEDPLAILRKNESSKPQNVSEAASYTYRSVYRPSSGNKWLLLAFCFAMLFLTVLFILLIL